MYDAENDAGWITDAQETALLDQYEAGVTKLVNVGPPVPPAKQPGPLDAAAKYIGISVSDIQTGLKAGKSLGTIATDNGKTVDGLVTALTAQAKTNLDAAVTARQDHLGAGADDPRRHHGEGHGHGRTTRRRRARRR